MPQNIIDVSTFTDPIVAPVDGDPAAAASVVTAIQGLANRTAWLEDLNTPSLFDVNTWNPLVATSATNNVVNTSAEGWYYRIGKMVVAAGRVFGSTGASTGTLFVDNLPYAMQGTTVAAHTIVKNVAGNPFGAGYGNVIVGSVNGTLNTLELAASNLTTGAYSSALLTGWAASQSFEFTFCVTYVTGGPF